MHILPCQILEVVYCRELASPRLSLLVPLGWKEMRRCHGSSMTLKTLSVGALIKDILELLLNLLPSLK